MVDIKKKLLYGIVATHLPIYATSMQTPNGYLCNLCHSLQNDHPFPPPSAQDVVVRFSKSENEQFGLPWDRGITCLEVWDTVLDFANPNVFDQQSCRAMAAAYAPQCCNDIFEESPDSPDEVEQAVENIEEEESSDTELDVEELSVVSKEENSNDENTEQSESSNDDFDENNGYNNRRTAAMSHLRRARK